MSARCVPKGLAHGAFLCGLLTSVSCSGPSGAGYNNVGIVAERLDTGGDTVETIEHCFTLPLLLGSRIDDAYALDADLNIVASATRDVATVSVVSGMGRKVITHEFSDFESPWSESFEVVSDEGTSFRVVLQNGCVFP